VRYLALGRRVPVGRLLRRTLAALLEEFGHDRTPLVAYEERAENYLGFVAQHERTFRVMREAVIRELEACDAADLVETVGRILDLDEALCPRTGARSQVVRQFDFAAEAVARSLMAMELPDSGALAPGRLVRLAFDHPGLVGEVLRDPDGGEWMRGRPQTGTERDERRAC
jgi:hypothetical protein